MEKTDIDMINNSSDYLSFQSIQLLEAENGCSIVQMQITDSVSNIYGTVHGGALFTLADTAAGAACFSRGKKCVTLNTTIHFMRPGISGILKAYAKEIHRGNKTGLYDVTIQNEKEETICSASFTFYILD